MSMLLPGLATAGEAIHYGDFWLFDEAPKAIVFQGDITAQTPLDFRTALIRRPDAELLVLSSDGGDVTAGLLFADDVHERGLGTYIPAGASCMSACAYVFLAGVSRLADGDLGVHQFYGGPETAVSAQYTMSDLLTYLRRFDTSDGVIDAMLRTPPYDIHVFSAKEKIEFAVDHDPRTVLAATLDLRAVPKTSLQWERPSQSSVAATNVSPKVTEKGNEPLVRFALYGGVDFYGADIRKLRASDAGQCFSECLDTKMCIAITFNINPNLRKGPNCFLKTGVGRTTFYPDAVSGIILLEGDSDALQVEGRTVRPLSVISSDD